MSRVALRCMVCVCVCYLVLEQGGPALYGVGVCYLVLEQGGPALCGVCVCVTLFFSRVALRCMVCVCWSNVESMLTRAWSFSSARTFRVLSSRTFFASIVEFAAENALSAKQRANLH